MLILLLNKTQTLNAKKLSSSGCRWTVMPVTYPAGPQYNCSNQIIWSIVQVCLTEPVVKAVAMQHEIPGRMRAFRTSARMQLVQMQREIKAVPQLSALVICQSRLELAAHRRDFPWNRWVRSFPRNARHGMCWRLTAMCFYRMCVYIISTMGVSCH